MTKNKPTMQKEVAVKVALKSVRHIVFYSTADALSSFSEFGFVCPDSDTREDSYLLSVDPRFEFDDVVAYMENYG